MASKSKVSRNKNPFGHKNNGKKYKQQLPKQTFVVRNQKYFGDLTRNLNRRAVFVIVRDKEGLKAQSCSKSSRIAQGAVVNLARKSAEKVNEGDVVAAHELNVSGVLASYTEYRQSSNKAYKNVAVIVDRIIGHVNDYDISTTAIMTEHDLKETFSQKVLDEIENRTFPSLAEGYRDLRSLPFITVDPDVAKNLDDAILSIPIEKGGFEVYTAITDVARFVNKVDTPAIFKEAQKRREAVRLQHLLIHLLPPELTQKFCSLFPRQDRATIVSKSVIDKEGNWLSGDVFPALINSKARLSPAVMQEAFEGKVGAITAPLMKAGVIGNLYAASNALNISKNNRGAISEFGIHEWISKGKYRYKSSDVVENFSLLGGYNVGKKFNELGIEHISRCNPKPKNTEQIIFNARKLGIKLEKNFKIDTSKDFMELVHKVKAVEKRNVIVRSKAKVLRKKLFDSLENSYDSINDRGHFSLSYDYYVPFNSPINEFSALVNLGCLRDAFNMNSKNKGFSCVREVVQGSELKLKGIKAINKEVDRRSKVASLRDATKNRFEGVVVDNNAGNKSKSDVIIYIPDFDLCGTIPGNVMLGAVRKSRSLGVVINFNKSAKLEIEVVEANPLTSQIILAPVVSEK